MPLDSTFSRRPPSPPRHRKINVEDSPEEGGVVSFFNERKGFGFIRPDRGGNDIFVHISAVEKSGLETLREGERVFFSEVSNRGKSAAIDISPIRARSGFIDLERAPKNDSQLYSNTRDNQYDPLRLPADNFVDAVNEWASNGLTSPSRIRNINAGLEISAKPRLIVMRAFSDEMVKALQLDPYGLYGLHSDKFEDLVARMSEENGGVVEYLGGRNRADGGVDLLVTHQIDGVMVRFAIQCKRYARHKKVTAVPIRSLNGVLDRFKADRGVIATTSTFTKPSKREQAKFFWSITLKDFDDMVSAIKQLRVR